MRRLWIAGLAAAALVAAAALWSPWPRDEPPTIAETAEELVASGVPGVLVRVRDGDDVRELAAGQATAGARFRVGSVTKTFVAALALDLAERGVLSLDDSVANYEPRLCAMHASSRFASCFPIAPACSTTRPIRSCFAASSIHALSWASQTGSRARPATPTRARTISRSGSSSSAPRAPLDDQLQAADPRPVRARPDDVRAGRARRPLPARSRTPDT